MKFIFAGNRRFVLEEMLNKDLEIVEILVAAGTHLEKDIRQLGLSYKTFTSKQELIDIISDADFDVFVSNGCPYILPIGKLPTKTYVNIHPSLLPDLKGIDPVIGSILYQRNAGATCHIMDIGIDTGEIISQVKIPYTKDLDVSLLYQLSFIAEKEAFNQAFAKDFKASMRQVDREDLIYYSRRPEDKIIFFTETNQMIINKVKAFSNKSQGCSFIHKDQELRVYGVSRLSNPFLVSYADGFTDKQIIFSYEDSIVFKKDGELIKFDKVSGDLSKVQVGDSFEVLL
jgi:methionyl-tRNA formyltransferase